MNRRHIQLLKKILVLSAIAGILGLLRFVVTQQSSYLWLNWNLFLALLPIFIAWVTIKFNHHSLLAFGVITWLFFLPNAPYLITDFIHLDDVGPKSILWYDAIMIFVYSLAGLLSWVLSFDMLFQKFKWKPWVIWLVAGLSGFGIYLGRYIRFNTWDIVTHPLGLMETIGSVIISPLEHNPVLPMTIVFGILLASIYIYIQPLLKNEKTSD